MPLRGGGLVRGRGLTVSVSQREKVRESPLPLGEGWVRVCTLLPWLLSACGTPTACLANRYEPNAPQARCVSGLQLPNDILKDTDPMSGSSAPITVAR